MIAERAMPTYSVADAKNHLPKLIDRALAGEEVVITRRGRPVVELRTAIAQPVQPKSQKEWHDWLFERAHPPVGLTSVQLLDLLYEEDEDEHLFGHQRPDPDADR
jgi:prevent-host-death family protein